MDMTAGKDYIVSYKNNIKVGTAQIVITFADKSMVKDGSGVMTINYKIKK